VGVGIVLSSQRDEVLACRRRAGDYWGGWWEFPGGKCAGNESPRDCVIRELREEVGITVAPTRVLTTIQHHYADRDRLVHLHPFLCDLVSGEPTAVEVAEIRWCTIAALRELQFLPANGPMIDELERLMTTPE
jgi:8-oxo-dGTP diphosphatase